MKSVAGGIIAAIILFAGGAAAWSEAQLTRRAAHAHERLATLHYDPDDDLNGGNTWLSKLVANIGGTAADDVARHRASVSYWRGSYQVLTDTISGATQAPTDAQLLFVAANATFREAAPETLDRKTAVDRLDGVIQSYAEVLRKDPLYSDAAYNYEYVTRLRDSIAKGPAGGRPAAKDKKAPAKMEEASVDLPAGPTIHGRPGGPPDGTDMSDFKTISPMRYDEREEQTDPGKGKEIRRKG